jgi:p-aminobenzoyl-glutamate transporter AbgT
MKLNIFHYMLLVCLSVCFIIIYYETLHHVTNRHKKINRICNSSYFRLFVGCIYFVLLVVFTYETSDIANQRSHHSILNNYGINMTNGMVFLLTIIFVVCYKFFGLIRSVK